MDLNQPRILGKTGLKVGPLGVASSYGAPTNAFEEAFERGCNYFYWGSQRKDSMRQAIKNICGQGKRDDLIIVIQSYSRSAFLMEAFFKKAVNSLVLDCADVLLLGWHNKKPTISSTSSTSDTTLHTGERRRRSSPISRKTIGPVSPLIRPPAGVNY